MLANILRLPAAANQLNVDKNSATHRVVLIFENAAFGLFWNNVTKIKTMISLIQLILLSINASVFFLVVN